MTYKVFIELNTNNEEQNKLLKELYIKQINKLNANKDNEYKDSGFDLYIPNQISIWKGNNKLIDLGIKCAVYKYADNNLNANLLGRTKLMPSAYYLYPRSSISKTNLRLANSVGIIDSGYRGNLMISIDNIDNTYQQYNISVGQRLVQICMPDLSSDFTVEIVDKLNNTDRGSGGFGSTGV